VKTEHNLLVLELLQQPFLQQEKLVLLEQIIVKIGMELLGHQAETYLLQEIKQQVLELK
jgi:hypothetical protein